MWSRLQQNGVLVDNLEESIALYRRLLDIRFTRCAVLPKYKVRNSVIPLGGGNDTFEVMEPYADDAPARKSMQRRGGAHPWLLVVHCDEIEPLTQDLDARGTRVVKGAHDSFFIHPSETPGLFVHNVNHTFAGHGPDWRDVPLSGFTEGLAKVAAVVKDIDKEVERYTGIYGLKEDGRIDNAQMTAVRLAFGPSHLVLMEPKDESTAVGRFAKGGPWQYATCINVRDLDAARERAADCGLQTAESDIPFCPGLMIEPTPQLGTRLVLNTVSGW